MASVILGTILLSVLVIIIADVPNSVSNSSQASDLVASQLPECQWTEWRLPQNVTPTAYNLQLQTNLQEPYTVTGYVEIQLSIPKPTLCVVLSVAAMTITNVSLLSPAVSGRHSPAWSGVPLAILRIHCCMNTCMQHHHDIQASSRMVNISCN